MRVTGTCQVCKGQVPYAGSRIDRHGYPVCEGSYKKAQEAVDAGERPMTAEERKLSRRVFG